MKELQNEVTEALYSLRALITTLTVLHSFVVLSSRPLPWKELAGVPSAELVSARSRRALDGRILLVNDFGREGSL